MKFIEIAKKRYSVRKYQQKEVERDKLDMILEAARVAPTGVNAQAFRIIVAQQEESLNKIKKAANIYGAPLVIIVCGDHDKVWKRPFDGKKLVDIDTSIVTDHMMLQATELGLGSVWICFFKPDVIKEEFNLPDNMEPVSILAIGYADGEPLSPDRHSSQRRPVEELVTYM